MIGRLKVKHKYLVMYHPVLKWGAPIPTLQPSKTFVAKATGVTQQMIRKNGWVWVPVSIETPEEAAPMMEALRLFDVIAELQGELDARLAEMSPEDRRQVIDARDEKWVAEKGLQ